MFVNQKHFSFSPRLLMFGKESLIPIKFVLCGCKGPFSGHSLREKDELCAVFPVCFTSPVLPSELKKKKKCTKSNTLLFLLVLSQAEHASRHSRRAVV